MTLRLLKILVTVYEYNSITKASEKLFISQPSVSIAIQELEKYYDVQLFVRANKKLLPTDSCKLLYGYAKQALTSFEMFERMATQGQPIHQIKLGASVTTGKYIVPALLKFVDDCLPQVRLSVNVNQRKAIIDLLKKGEIDIALTSGEIPHGNFIAQSLTPDRIVIVAGANYPVADKMTDLQISRQRWILRESGSASRDFWDKYLKEKNLDIEPYISSSSTQMIIQCITDNLGIGVLPYSLVKNSIANGILREIKLSDEIYSRQHNLLVNKNAIDKPFINEIINQCHKLADTINH